jgi:GTP1/Obg family GTP-binding protein
MDRRGEPRVYSVHGLPFQDLRFQREKKVTLFRFRTTRIFKSLSSFLKTRTPRQCRSHFQKIMSKFKTVKKVKQFYQKQLGVLMYQDKYDAVADKLKSLPSKSEESLEKPSKEAASVSVQTEPLSIRLSDLPDH